MKNTNVLIGASSCFLLLTLLGHEITKQDTFAWAEPPTWKKLPNPNEKTIEKISQTSFSNAIIREDLGDNKLLRLCAVSIRCMLGLCFLDPAQAYSFGVYLSSQAVEDICGQNGSLERINPLPEKRVGAAPFYPSERFTGSRPGYAFYNGPSGVGYYRDPKSTPKSDGATLVSPILIRLIMLRDVDGEHVANGFDKTLRSRVLPHVSTSSEELEQLSRLKMCFNRLERLPKGSHIDL
jgi:hypothetical protein